MSNTTEYEFIKINNQTHAADNATSLEVETILNRLDNYLNNSQSIITTGVCFKVRDPQNISSYITICDTGLKDWTKNILTSLQVEQVSSETGVVNSFTLRLTYVLNDILLTATNYIDTILNSIYDVDYVKNNTIDETSLNSVNNCKFRYGYGNNEDLMTPWFYGYISDYTCTFNEDSISYEIKGTSISSNLVEVKFSTTTDRFILDDKKNKITNPLKYLHNLFTICVEQYLSDKNNANAAVLYKIKFDENLKTALDDNSNKRAVYISTDNNNNQVIDKGFETYMRKNIFEIMDDVLKSTMLYDEYEKLEDATKTNEANKDSGEQTVLDATLKSSFGYYVDDTIVVENGVEYKGTLIIFRSSIQDSNAQPACHLTYGSKGKEYNARYLKTHDDDNDGDLDIENYNVISVNVDFHDDTLYDSFSLTPHYIIKKWQPDFKPSTVNAYYNNLRATGTIRATITNNGEIANSNGVNSTTEGNEIGLVSKNDVMDYSVWNQAIKYSVYTATVDLVGVPYAFPINMLMVINIFIVSQPHFTSGVYMVTGVTQIIDDSGFITRLKLTKRKSNFNYLEGFEYRFLTLINNQLKYTEMTNNANKAGGLNRTNEFTDNEQYAGYTSLGLMDIQVLYNDGKIDKNELDVLTYLIYNKFNVVGTPDGTGRYNYVIENSIDMKNPDAYLNKAMSEMLNVNGNATMVFQQISFSNSMINYYTDEDSSITNLSSFSNSNHHTSNNTGDLSYSSDVSHDFNYDGIGTISVVDAENTVIDASGSRYMTCREFIEMCDRNGATTTALLSAPSTGSDNSTYETVCNDFPPGTFISSANMVGMVMDYNEGESVYIKYYKLT